MKSSGLKAIATLKCFMGFGKTTCCLCITNNNLYRKDFDDFFKSLKLEKKTDKAVTNIKNNPGTPDKNFGTPNKLAGIWQGININTSDFIDKNTGTPIWLVFYDNGRVAMCSPRQLMKLIKTHLN